MTGSELHKTPISARATRALEIAVLNDYDRSGVRAKEPSRLIQAGPHVFTLAPIQHGHSLTQTPFIRTKGFGDAQNSRRDRLIRPDKRT